MARIKIVVDTSCDMPEELRAQYDIGRLSFLSIFGEDTYVTGVNLTNEQFYDMLEASERIPTTAQTPYQDMYDAFLEWSRDYDTVIFFAISSKGSGQGHTAAMVAEDIAEENPNADIRIVDSMAYSLLISAGAIYAAKLAAEGVSADEIVEKAAAEIGAWHALLLVDTLKYLEKGGRINKTSAIIGTLLDIKPVLTVKNGLMEAEEKLRGKKKLLQKLVDLVEECEDFDAENPRFMVVHSDQEKGEELCRLLCQKYGEGVVEIVSEFGPIVGTHVGRGAAAVIFRKK